MSSCSLQSTKKRIDPTKPRKRRTQSAYMLWMNKTGRALAKSQYPDLKVTQIASLCGRYWREMDDSEKKHWQDQAEILKAQYRAADAE